MSRKYLDIQVYSFREISMKIVFKTIKLGKFTKSVHLDGEVNQKTNINTEEGILMKI